MRNCYFYWSKEIEAAQRRCDLATELSQARKNGNWSQGSLIPRTTLHMLGPGSLVEGDRVLPVVSQRSKDPGDPTCFQGAAP